MMFLKRTADTMSLGSRVSPTRWSHVRSHPLQLIRIQSEPNLKTSPHHLHVGPDWYSADRWS